MSTCLQLKNIYKSFYSVQALKDVSIDIESGEIHVVIGENGAGKSTLMKIAAGLYKQDKGEIVLDGKEMSFQSPLDAIDAQISMIHQELMPIPYLTVAENIFLGKEPVTKYGLLDKKKAIEQTKTLLGEIGIDLDPMAEMRTLSVAQIQLVEIAKAVSCNSKILIMDEPTSALTENEVELLYKLIFDMKKRGVAIVFISHKLDEIFKVADKITVLRDGEYITTEPASELNKDSLIALMIGRDLNNIYDKEPVKIGEPILEVCNLTKEGLFENISFTLRQNEILGFSGLMGAGRTELVETIFGLRKADSGEIYIHGKLVNIKSPTEAKKYGLALVPEDRKVLGLNLKDTTGFNTSICSLDELSVGGVINKKQESQKIEKLIDDMNVKVESASTPVITLSGGNQQKVVIAKWMMTEPEILIMDEPTRGIDVGAKAEIYKLITQLVQQNKSVILISSELPEVMGMSDRVIVLHEGIITGEFNRGELNQQDIMRCATGQKIERQSAGGENE